MRVTLLCVTLLLLSLGAADARAQRRGSSEIDQAIEQLSSSDRADVQTGLETLGLLGSPRAVAPISATIRRGLPTELLEIAVDTLSILGRSEAGPVLFELLSHRRETIRLKAVQAIVATSPRGADQALVRALSDSDPAVRGGAAEGLGTLGATSAIDPLFHAMERDVEEAPMAIALIARPADVARFLELLGRMPFDRIAPALSEMLMRDDLQERARLDIIHHLTELATAGVREFLEDFVASLPEGESSAVRRAAEDAIPRIGQ